jgi:hypothetical protein
MDLTARVTRLERENRRLKRGAACLVLAGLMIVTFGQARPAAPTSQQAAEFAVVDEKGKVRARLAASDGEPTLELTNAAGQTVVQLQVPAVPDKPVLYLRDPQLGSSIELAMTMNGPVLHFSDKSGTRVRLATNELNAPLAALYDDRGRKLFEVSAEAKQP